jgi:hypothetical protein
LIEPDALRWPWSGKSNGHRVGTTRGEAEKLFLDDIWRIMADDVGTGMSGPKQFMDSNLSLFGYHVFRNGTYDRMEASFIRRGLSLKLGGAGNEGHTNCRFPCAMYLYYGWCCISQPENVNRNSKNWLARQSAGD